MPSRPKFHHVVEEGAHGFRIGSVEERRISRDAEAAAEGFFDRIDGNVVSALAANRKVMLFALAVEVHAEGQVLTRLEEMNLFFQQQGVGAEIDIFLARHQALDDLTDLRMHERLAAGDRHHGRSAFVNRAKTFFGRKIFLQNVRRVLNLAASGAGQVAAEQRLEHQHERILLAPGKLLPQHITRHSPHL